MGQSISLIKYREGKIVQISLKALLIGVVVFFWFPLNERMKIEQEENLFLEKQGKVNQEVEGLMKDRKWEKALDVASQAPGLKIIKTPAIQESLDRLKKNVLACQENLFLEKQGKVNQEVEGLMKEKEWEVALSKASHAPELKITKTPAIQESLDRLKKNVLACQEGMALEHYQNSIACMKAKKWEEAIGYLDKVKSMKIEKTSAIQETLNKCEKYLRICRVKILSQYIEKKQWNNAREQYSILWRSSTPQEKAELENYAPKIPPIKVQYELPEEKILYIGKEYSFKATSADIIHQILWEYGDGESSNKAETKHIYKKTGEMTVKITLNDGLNKVTRNKTYIIVEKMHYIFGNNWTEYSYEIQKGEFILDMTADAWGRLSVEEQKKYASQYQLAFAEEKNMELEKKITRHGVVFEFRLIPPGRFWMGSPADEPGRDSDEQRHRVILSKPYYMQKTEITQKQWRAVTGEHPWLGKPYMENNDSHAAAYISLDYVKQKLLPRLGSKFGLPTEAQWEYACRAGTTGRFYWGDSKSEMGQYANSRCGYDNYRYISPVASFKPNAFGLYDMSGNVWEWCEDAMTDYGSQEEVDPCTQSGYYRVIRGGHCFSEWADSLRSARRNSSSYDFSGECLGVRLFLRP